VVLVERQRRDIALPSAQRARGFSHTDRQRIVTAYTLGFGGLLLRAGHVAGMVRRQHVLIVRPVGVANRGRARRCRSDPRAVGGRRELEFTATTHVDPPQPHVEDLLVLYLGTVRR
jgi:hypothetical protein